MLSRQNAEFTVCVWEFVGHLDDTEPTEIKTHALFLTLSVFNSVVILLINPPNDIQDFGWFVLFIFLAL